jgi:hypothetical protein
MHAAKKDILPLNAAIFAELCNRIMPDSRNKVN